MKKKFKGVSLVLALGIFFTLGTSTLVSANTVNEKSTTTNYRIVRSVSTDPGEFPVAN